MLRETRNIFLYVVQEVAGYSPVSALLSGVNPLPRHARFTASPSRPREDVAVIVRAPSSFVVDEVFLDVLPHVRLFSAGPFEFVCLGVEENRIVDGREAQALPVRS